MQNRTFISLLVAGLACGAVASASAAPALRVSCDDYTNSGASMWVRYIDSGERQTFDVVLKMPVKENNLAQPRPSVLVGVANVGQVTLKPNAGGTMSGSLSYDSYASDGEAAADVFPFPGTWTGAVSGSLVRIAGLSCELRD